MGKEISNGNLLEIKRYLEKTYGNLAVLNEILPDPTKPIYYKTARGVMLSKRRETGETIDLGDMYKLKKVIGEIYKNLANIEALLK